MRHDLSERQVEVMLAAYRASDGWINRGFSRIWGTAPMAVVACRRKGLLDMPHGRARLSVKGREVIEGLIATDPMRYGLARRA